MNKLDQLSEKTTKRIERVSKTLWVGIGLIAFGIFGLLGLLSDTEDKGALLGGSLVFIAVGAVVAFIGRKPAEPRNYNRLSKHTAPTATAAEPYVFVNLHGKKFHYDPNCSKGKTVVKMDLSKARAAGRTACNKCCYQYLHRD